MMMGWQGKQREKVFPDEFGLAGVIAEVRGKCIAGILEAMIITRKIAI